MKWSKNYSICCNSSNGPTFGYNDFYIADRSNINTISESNLSLCFAHPDYRFERFTEARTLLAGSFNFQVSDIEVFTKQ